MATYLARILEHHRARAEADTRSIGSLVDAAASLSSTRSFAEHLRREDRLNVISEIKRRSPSKGDLSPFLDPAALATRYRDGGAAALSVLTDGPHFGGAPDDLVAARAAVELPVLRKDFTVSSRDVYDTRIMGADCVLLIVAALSDDELATFDSLAASLGLAVLVETHDEAEVQRALEHTSASIIGVNQRDLVTFEVDQQRAVRVADAIPATSIKVAESGVRGPEDASALADAGYDAVLVGEYLVTAADPIAALTSLRVAVTAR